MYAKEQQFFLKLYTFVFCVDEYLVTKVSSPQKYSPIVHSFSIYWTQFDHSKTIEISTSRREKIHQKDTFDDSEAIPVSATRRKKIYRKITFLIELFFHAQASRMCPYHMTFFLKKLQKFMRITKKLSLE